MFVPQAGKIITKSDDPNHANFGSFWQRPVYYEELS